MCRSRSDDATDGRGYKPTGGIRPDDERDECSHDWRDGAHDDGRCAESDDRDGDGQRGAFRC